MGALWASSAGRWLVETACVRSFFRMTVGLQLYIVNEGVGFSGVRQKRAAVVD